MTEERLKEIKDNMGIQLYSIENVHLDGKIIGEKWELYNEVVRLRDNNEMAISLCNEYLYHDDVCGNKKNTNYEELKNVLTRNNLTLEQINGIDNK